CPALILASIELNVAVVAAMRSAAGGALVQVAPDAGDAAPGSASAGPANAAPAMSAQPAQARRRRRTRTTMKAPLVGDLSRPVLGGARQMTRSADSEPSSHAARQSQASARP